MTNGNFGGPPTGGSGQGFGAGGGFGQQPPGGGAFGQPSGGGAVPTTADFGAALDVFKRLMGQMLPTGLLGGFVAFSAAELVANVPLWLAQYLQVRSLQSVMDGSFGRAAEGNLLAIGLSIVGAVLMLLIAAGRLGLARPMRMIALEGPGSVKGTGDVLRLALGGFGPNLGMLLLYIVAVGMGWCSCLIPGLIVAIALYPATYLVATGRDLGTAFSLSLNWMQRHPGALLGTVGVVLVIALLLICCNCGLSSSLTSRFGPMAGFYVLPIVTLVGEVLSVVTLTFLGSGCIAADQADSAALRGSASAGPF